MKAYPFFRIDELSCRCGCDIGEMDNEFMSLVVAIRQDLSFQFPVHSAYRCPAHDQAVGGSGVHPTGMAIDIGVYGERAYRLIRAAQERGIGGIGIKQHGLFKKRFIHLDITKRLSPWIWSYP